MLSNDGTHEAMLVAPDQAAFLEPIGDPGDVGRVAMEELRQLPHRLRLVESVECDPVRRHEVVLAALADIVATERARHSTADRTCVRRCSSSEGETQVAS